MSKHRTAAATRIWKLTSQGKFLLPRLQPRIPIKRGKLAVSAFRAQEMDMEIDDSSKDKAKGKEDRGKLMVVLLVGVPGSGKSTFCENLISSSTRSWVRVCQDTIANGKSGTRAQCLKSAASALKDGKNVLIDRCNMEKEQRADFVKLVTSQVEVHAVVLDLPAQLCISRSVKRSGHEGNLQGGKAAAVVNKMMQKKEFPKLSEGFTHITFCQNESDVQSTLNTYSSLGPLNTLPHGFGKKNPSAKVQLGIMKFLKKADDHTLTGYEAPNIQNSSPQAAEIKSTCSEIISSVSSHSNKELKEGEDTMVESVEGERFSNNAQTLAFPSISTADFQFSLEKASEIIVEKVEEFMDKLGNSRLVLVDLSHRSKILSLVKAKSDQRNIDSSKFSTFVGDITQLYSKGGLRCNVIANAANWRLKPGGGGVNAAIFKAAGTALEVATKEQAKSLQPGNAVVVPLPAASPLFKEEGVTHVIHVLGPNMNSQRPNCLNNDYNKGSELLRAAYTSLFQGFLSLVRNQSNLAKDCNDHFESRPLESPKQVQGVARNPFYGCDQKMKRESVPEFEKSKKCKGYQLEDDTDLGSVNTKSKKIGEDTSKAWGSWAQSLYKIAIEPETHKDEVLETLDDVVVLNDIYPKAHRHVLVLARAEGLECLANVRADHLQLLRKMHAVGLKWAEKFIHEDASLVFRLGYHSAPSMRQLHLHLISQDFNSKHLKNKKHWNSFNTAFFRDSVDVIEEIDIHGKATVKDDESLISMELRCNRCRSAHPNIPKLKLHISHCQAPFPSHLLQNRRLVQAPTIDNDAP